MATETETPESGNEQGTGEGNQGTSLLGGESEVPQGGEGGESKGQETTDEYASLKLPEGASVDEKFFGDVKTWAKKSGIKVDALQGLVDSWGSRFKESQAEQAAAAKQERAKRNQEWVSELEGDKEFGGSKFKENIAGLRGFLNKVDPDKVFRTAIVKAGIDNWPPLVKFLHGLAAASKDDSVMGTLEGAKPSAASDEGAFLDEMYPTQRK